MKKTMIMLIAMVVALTAPAAATLEIRTDGKLDALFEYRQNDDGAMVLDAHSGIDLSVGVNLGREGSPLSGRLEFGGPGLSAGYSDGAPDGTLTFDNWARVGDPLGSLELRRAFIDARGALWHGGPPLDTRVGSVAVNYHDWVAHLGNRNGVTVSGLNYGPVAARVFAALDGAQVAGVQLDAGLAGLDLGGTVVRHGAGMEFAADARARVTNQVSVDGRLALDPDRNAAYRIATTVEPLPNLTVRAQVRDADPNYAATYAHGSRRPVAGQRAFALMAATEVMDVAVAADYEHIVDGDQTVALKAATDYAGFGLAGETKLKNWELDSTKVSVTTDLPLTPDISVATAYDLTINHAAAALTHDLAAATRLDLVPSLRNLGVHAGLTVGDGATWRLGADYAAPNGMQLAAGYDSEAGASISVGVGLGF